MGFVASLVWTAVSVALSFLLRPRPRIERIEPFENFDLPITEEGSPVSLVWGRVRIRNPNVLWYGDLDTEDVTEQRFLREVVVAREHFVGLQFGLCLSSPTANATLYKIWIEDFVVKQSTPTVATDSGFAFTIDEPSLFGGRAGGGGFVSTVRFYGGTRNQNRNNYLQDNVGNTILNPFPPNQLPGYRGLSHVVLERANIGESPQIRAMSFEVEVIPNALGTTVSEIGDGDANPAEVLYDILSGDWGRLALTTDFRGQAILDADSFRAAAQTLGLESHGISLQISSASSARDVVRGILEQIDGVLYEEPTDRTLQLRLIRDDYDVGTLPVFDENDIAEIIDYSVTQWADTVNEVRVRFQSRFDDYKTKTAYANDAAHVNSLNGRVRTAEFDFPGVKTRDLANAIAARELAFLSQPIAKMRIRVNRRAATLRPGDPLIVAWSDYNITQIVMRVQRFDLGEFDDGTVTLDLVEDRFGVDYRVFADPPVDLHSPPSLDPSPVTIARIVEMPRWYGVRGQAAELFADPESPRLVYLAAAPSTVDTQFESQFSTDAGVTFATDVDGQRFTSSATVATAYPFDTDEYDTTTGLVIDNVEDPTLLVATSQANIETQGTNLLVVGDEWLAFETVTDNFDGSYTLGNVWRGVLDTSPRPHAVGQRVWLFFAVEFNAIGETVFLASEQDLQARLLSRTGVRKLDPALANVITDIDIENRAVRAYPPVQLTVDGVAHPTEITSDITIPLTWARRDRQTSTVVRPDAADETPAETTRYIARYRVDGGAFTETVLAGPTSGELTISNGVVDLEVYAELGTDPNTRSLYPVTRSFTMNVPVVGNALFYDTYLPLTPGGAWGLRQMISTYAGALVRLRDSLGVEEDVGFDGNGDLNTPTGTAPFTVVRLYDQTGNGNDLIQTTLANQPTFNATGTAGGKPEIEFDGTAQFMETATFLGNSANALLLTEPVMFWAGDLPVSDIGFVAATYDVEPPEYGFARVLGSLTLYRDQSSLSSGFTSGESALISQVGSTGFQLWQDSSSTVRINNTAQTGAVAYDPAQTYRLRIMRNSAGLYLQGGLSELSFHQGVTSQEVLDAAFGTPLTTYWRT